MKLLVKDICHPMCLVEITGDKNTFEQPYRSVQNSLGNIAVLINFRAKIKPKISSSHYENVQPNSIHPSSICFSQTQIPSCIIQILFHHQNPDNWGFACDCWGFACDCSHLYIYLSLQVSSSQKTFFSKNFKPWAQVKRTQATA